jgi:hypothetical protein
VSEYPRLTSTQICNTLSSILTTQRPVTPRCAASTSASGGSARNRSTSRTCRTKRYPIEGMMMSETYHDPVAQLLTLGDPHQEDPMASEWCDYLALGLAPEHVPELVRMALDEDLHRADPESAEVWAPLHAWRALGQLRAESAVEPLLQLLDRIDDDDDDWVQDDLPRVFGMIGPAAIPGLRDFLADAEHGVWARIAVSDGLVKMTQRFPETREQAVAIITGQLRRFAEQEYVVNAFLVNALCDLKAVESAAVIEQAFDADMVELSVLSLPDTFCQARHLEGHRDVDMFIQEMIEQIQAELEETQVAAVSAVNNLDPVVPLGNHAQIDDPDVGQASSDQQAGQARRVRDMTSVQVEPSALLVGEESLNPVSFGVPVTSFFGQFHIRDQVDGLFVSGFPPGNGLHWAVGLKGEGHIGQTNAFPWLYTDFVEGESVALCPQLGILGRAADVFPPVGIDSSLEGDTIELSITEEDHVSLFRYYLVDSFQQPHVRLFREMALVPGNDDPSNGQRAFLVDHADHQYQALAPCFAAVYGQEQWAVGSQAFQQCISVGQEVDLSVYPLVLHPAVESLDTALPLGSVRSLASNRGQIGAPATHDAADERSQCV